MRTKKWIKRAGVSVLRYFILTGLSFLILYPLVVTLMISIMSPSDFTNSSVRYLSLSPTLDFYENAAIFLEYGPTVLKSVLLNTALCLFEIFSCTLVAYGFARFSFRGNGFLFACVLLTLLIPTSAYFTPLYLSFSSFGPFQWNLLETPIPLFLLSATALGLKNGLLIFILRQHFRAYPKALEEAASIDGAGTFSVFWRIMLPGAVSVMVTCFVLIFVWKWTDPTYTNVFMPDKEFIWTKLASIEGNMSLLPGVDKDDVYYRAILQNASLVLYLIPVLIVFVIGKRFLVESVETTGLVG